MFSGITNKKEELLYKKDTKTLMKETKFNGNDIIINIIETNRNNWGGRGGIPLSKYNFDFYFI